MSYVRGVKEKGGGGPYAPASRLQKNRLATDGRRTRLLLGGCQERRNQEKGLGRIGMFRGCEEGNVRSKTRARWGSERRYKNHETKNNSERRGGGSSKKSDKKDERTNAAEGDCPPKVRKSLVAPHRKKNTNGKNP